MISSVGVEAGNYLLTPTPLQTHIFSTHKPRLKSKPSTISSTLTQESSSISNAKKKLGVVVKPMEKSRLVLKFIWMENNIGIAIDQVIPGGRGTIPVSPYYFWPKKDAWEELKSMMDTKHWISYNHMVLLLNQASDIINLWQQHQN